MQPDLSKYELNEFEELLPWIEKYGSRFWDFMNRVEKKLDSIPPGGILEVLNNVREENYELFTKIACYYMKKEFIALGPISQRTYYFNKYYTIISRFNYPIPKLTEVKVL